MTSIHEPERAGAFFVGSACHGIEPWLVNSRAHYAAGEALVLIAALLLLGAFFLIAQLA